MKKLFILFAAALLFAACSNSGSSTEEKKESSMAMSNDNMDNIRKRNEDVAMAGMQAFIDHNIDGMMKDAAKDAVDYRDGSSPVLNGVDSIKAFMIGVMNAFPDIKSNGLVVCSSADGKTVSISGEWTGTFKNDFMGMKATNKQFKYWDTDIFTFNDEGKVTSHRAVQSNMVFLSQVK